MKAAENLQLIRKLRQLQHLTANPGFFLFQGARRLPIAFPDIIQETHFRQQSGGVGIPYGIGSDKGDASKLSHTDRDSV